MWKPMWPGLRGSIKPILHACLQLRESKWSIFCIIQNPRSKCLPPSMSLHPSKKVDKILYRFVVASFD